MSCYECAVQGQDAPAVATCTHCGVGMCLEHFRAQHDYRVGGTTYGSRHDTGTSTHQPSVRNAHQHRWLRAAR